MRRFVVALTWLAIASLGCDEEPPHMPTPLPDPTTAVVRFVFLGSTTRRTDLPPSAQACVNGVGTTHIHPSWRSFDGIPLTPVPPGRYELTFTDVPLDTQVSFRINDQNSCDQNPTGAVTSNVLANEVPLRQNATTPVDEPGFAFSVTRAGTITQ
jgi:hypothetical protein